MAFLQHFYEHTMQSFVFSLTEVPFTHLKWGVGAGVVYLILLYLSQQWMKKRQPLNLRYFPVVHNLFLSGGSLLLLLGILYELNKFYQPYGVEPLFCDSNKRGVGSKGPLIFYYYVFYLSKFYELIDSFLLVAKKKTLLPLHVYHHFVTISTVWCSLAAVNPYQWVAVTANLSVHVVMYWYYALTTLGIYSKWKSYITTIQIIQFIVDLVAILATEFYNYFTGGRCSGELWGVIFPVVVLISFLYLFTDFYDKSYNKKGSEKGTEGKKEQQHSNGTPKKRAHASQYSKIF